VVIAVMSGSGGFALRCALCTLIVLAALRALSLHLWRSDPRAVVSVEYRRQGGWRLETRGGTQVAALKGAYLSRWLVILTFARGRLRDQSVLLLSDSLSKDELRRLRVWLRNQPGQEAS